MAFTLGEFVLLIDITDDIDPLFVGGDQILQGFFFCGQTSCFCLPLFVFVFLFEKDALLDAEIPHILLVIFEFGVETIYDISKFHFDLFPLKVLIGDCPIFLMKMYVFLSLLLTFTLSFEEFHPKLIYFSLLLRDVRLI